MNKCKTCKKMFEPAKHHPNQETCSQSCYKKSRRSPSEAHTYRLVFSNKKSNHGGH